MVGCYHRTRHHPGPHQITAGDWPEHYWITLCERNEWWRSKLANNEPGHDLCAMRREIHVQAENWSSHRHACELWNEVWSQTLFHCKDCAQHWSLSHFLNSRVRFTRSGNGLWRRSPYCFILPHPMFSFPSAAVSSNTLYLPSPKDWCDAHLLVKGTTMLRVHAFNHCNLLRTRQSHAA